MNALESREKWERAWASLPYGVPDYFQPGELDSLARLRFELIGKYLGGIGQVSEFGCGMGHNLVPLMGRGIRLRGFDWSTNAVMFCQRLGLEASVFDMFEPDQSVELKGAVLTVHALEQLGGRWLRFLDFLCDQKPDISIHIEPIEELYDDSEHDQACLAYHRKRGYLTGFLTGLRALEEAGCAEILEVRKSEIHGINHDAYSVVVWRPL